MFFMFIIIIIIIIKYLKKFCHLAKIRKGPWEKEFHQIRQI
jgi:hypothetical protein